MRQRSRCRGGTATLTAQQARAGVGIPDSADAADPSHAYAIARMLAREVAAGLGAGLADEDVARILEVQHVMVRVGAGDPPEVWQATAWLRPGDSTQQRPEDESRRCPDGGHTTAESPKDDVPMEPGPPPAVGRLPIQAVHGVGATWGRRLAALGVVSVADLTVFDPTRADGPPRIRRQVSLLVGRAQALSVAALGPGTTAPPRLTISVAATTPAAALARAHRATAPEIARWQRAAAVAMTLLDTQTCDRLPLGALVRLS